MIFAFFLYLMCGCFAGMLGGLLGVGGGLIIVPILVYTLPWFNVPQEHILYMAIGTSLATIMSTSLASSRAHYKRGAVNVELLKNITPGIIVGTFIGGIIASYIPVLTLKAIFIGFVYFVATLMLSERKPKASRHLPGMLGTSAVGSVIGLISSFVGIGGGTLSVPFAMHCNEPVHRAIGTSAAIGFPIAVSGALGYVVAGWNAPNLPPYALGYVHGIALLGIATSSFMIAPIGAKLSHSLPIKTLKRFFAFFLYTMATKMLYDFYFMV